MAKAAEKAKPDAEAQPDGPLLDLNADAVKKMIRTAKKRGYVTTEELNSVLPSEEVTSEQIEDTMAMLNDMGINVVEEDEVEEQEGSTDLVEAGKTAVTTTTKKREPTDRTDDPVRMYLREMGTVELLSREGEIAIAKRIEAGRETMIAGLCESPLTFQAIIFWRDDLLEGNILLRDIIDLEATYAGPEAKQIDNSANPPGPNPGPVINRSHSTSPQEGDKKDGEEGEKAEGEGGEDEDEDDDDDDMENNLSLAAMEAELKPQVIEIFDLIADSYKKLRKLQDTKMEASLENGALSSAQQKRYKEITTTTVDAVKSLALNNNRIEALVEQLYDINKQLVGNEGRLLRLAESYGVKRAEFLIEYQV